MLTHKREVDNMTVLFPRPTFYQYRIILDGKEFLKDYAKKIISTKDAERFYLSLGYKTVTIKFCGTYKV